MITLEKLINATACAAAVLEGTAGGYSPEEKMNAKLTLNQLENELLAELAQSGLNPDEALVKQQLLSTHP